MKSVLAALLLLVAPALADDSERDFMRDGCRYPPSASADKAMGATTLRYTGMTDGTIRDVTIVTSSGRADLDDAAVACLSRWRFMPPPSLHGKTIVGTHEMTLEWAMMTDADGKLVGRQIGIPYTCLSYNPKSAHIVYQSGMVRVRFIITTEGTLRDLAIANTSGNADLDNFALECVAGWRYHVAIKDGRPVEIPWRTDVKVFLQQPEPPVTPSKP